LARPITFLLDQLAPGGAERHAVQLANSLDRARFSVGVTYLKPDHTLLPVLRRERLREIQCLEVRSGVDLGAARRFAVAQADAGVEVVVASNPYSTLYAIAGRRRAGVRYRVVCTYHTTLLHTLRQRLQMPFFAWAMRQSEALVYMSANQRDYWRGRGLRAPRECLIYNGVDVGHFSPAAALPVPELPAGWSAAIGTEFVVGICAGLRIEKAHADLVHAIARLQAGGVDARLIMIGDGPERSSLEALVRELRIAERVHITGFQQDVRSYVRCCNAVVLASQTETFSIASLEAMAMGKPMVMSDVGGAREQVTDGDNGLLFPQGDVAALAACLQRLASPAESRAMGERAMQRVRERFSFARMIAEYDALIEEVAAA
jgi:glycosyltransferase involved in cell wall biosynthesis